MKLMKLTSTSGIADALKKLFYTKHNVCSLSYRNVTIKFVTQLVLRV